MRSFLGVSLAVLVLLGAGTSGCATASLKETNRRLKEANDRLIAENNRLEQEIDELRQERESGRPSVATAPVTTNLANTPRASASDDATDLIISEVTGPGMPDGVAVTRSPSGIHVRIPDRVFFALGQAKLSSQGQAVLNRLGRILNREYGGHIVRVEGHTDDIPIRKVRHLYPTNWELSTARACTVVRYLVDRAGVDARRIYPAGYSYHRPLVSGSSSSARSKNRRVEITILNERV